MLIEQRRRPDVYLLDLPLRVLVYCIVHDMGMKNEGD